MVTLSEDTQRKHTAIVRKLIEQGRYSEAEQVIREHHRLIEYKEHIRASDITSKMNTADHEECNRLLRKVCILSDIVESAATELQELMRRYDRYVTMPLVEQTRGLVKLSGSIRGIVDAVGNIEYSESFGELCDDVDKHITEAFAREKKKTKPLKKKKNE